MKNIGVNKDIRKAATRAERLGWIITTTGGNRIKFLSPDKSVPPYYHALTGCRQSNTKTLVFLRKNGVPA